VRRAAAAPRARAHGRGRGRLPRLGRRDDAPRAAARARGRERRLPRDELAQGHGLLRF
jgi:hypothetical protein